MSAIYLIIENLRGDNSRAISLLLINKILSSKPIFISLMK
jgi:hypothetical protein